jgi:hypothetical protein
MTKPCSGHLELSCDEIGVTFSRLRASQAALVSRSPALLDGRTGARPNILLLLSILVGLTSFLLLLDSAPAQAARCSFPTQFYRPSLGICETKAGNSLYRARLSGKNLSKKLKSEGVLARTRSQPAIAPRVRQAPATEPEIIRNETAVPSGAPEPENADDQIAEFEARWWPVREVNDRHLRAGDGLRKRKGPLPNAVQ